jgi:hypothetical protein
MKKALFVTLLAVAGCGARSDKAPPVPAATPAPVLISQTVMVFPVQRGSVPVADATMQRSPIAIDKLDAEIAYWLPELANTVKWTLPAAIQRAITRSPSLAIDINNLAVGSFQRAQVKRVGDPLFGDLRKLAAVLDTRIAVIPVAAERLAAPGQPARVQIATAVLDALSGNVIWFGVIESDAEATAEDAGIASAAQAMARAFAGKRN